MTRNDKGQFTSGRQLEEHQELYRKYSEWIHLNSDTDSTITRREAGAEAWLFWCEENECDPIVATRDDVAAFIKGMLRDEYADTTISSRFASVSKFYHFLSTDPERPRETIENPTAGVNLRKDHGVKNNSEYIRIIHKEGRDDIMAPGYHELKPMFDHVPGKTGFTQVRNELICRLFWQTAMRSDEMARVKVDNVDLDEREIKIRSSKLNREDHPDLYRRSVFFESNLDYLLHRWFDKRNEKDPNGESPYLFIGTKGGGLSPSYLSRQVKKAAHKAGIQEPLVRNPDGGVGQWLYTAHRLRHSRITYLANKTDMGLNFVRMMAGHASIDTTLSYVDPDWNEARDAYREATGARSIR